MKNFQIQLSITILLILYGFVFFADYIAPYDPCEQNNKASYASPSKFGVDTHGIYFSPKMDEMIRKNDLSKEK